MRPAAACAVLLLLTATISAWGQAPGVGDAVDLAVEITADRDGCTAADCVHLRIAVRNTGTAERFVARGLLDVRHLRLTFDGQALTLSPTGSAQSDIRERLDAAGGARDRLERDYRLPECCAIVRDGKRLDRLPPGRYVVQYEGAAPEVSEEDAAAAAILRSAPASFTIDGSAPTTNGG